MPALFRSDHGRGCKLDDSGKTHIGDFLLHSDGNWSPSKGDEDVINNLDGKGRLITRTFQNWHTHLHFNARDFSDGLPLRSVISILPFRVLSLK